MKFRKIIFFVFIAGLLSACNMSLAEDVTPPPGAVQPAQPQPTMGPLFPAHVPDIQNGAAIYADNCAACHGENGLSDGVMTEQLTAQDITVPMLGAAEVARKATPADWYQMVTLGKIENFMPPFNSLSDQERWDVVAYAQSLSSTSEQIAQGEELFSENCGGCPTDFFTRSGTDGRALNRQSGQSTGRRRRRHPGAGRFAFRRRLDSHRPLFADADNTRISCHAQACSRYPRYRGCRSSVSGGNARRSRAG